MINTNALQKNKINNSNKNKTESININNYYIIFIPSSHLLSAHYACLMLLCTEPEHKVYGAENGYNYLQN